MKRKDTLGRTTFHSIDKPERILRPNDRDRQWFKQIERHGPQSSVYLYEATKGTHRCKDTALRRLKELRAAGFLSLPRQQRATEHADFNPYIYDLTNKARDHLIDCGIAEDAIKPHGHWVHAYMTACVTASIDITAQKLGIEYIPGHRILALKNAPLEMLIGKRKLIPDQLFALRSSAGVRAFALEVDRNTEPKTSNQARKSYQSSIELYAHVLAKGLAKSHYSLKTNLLILWVFSSRTSEQRFHELLKPLPLEIRAGFLTQVVDGFLGSWRPPPVWEHLLTDPWARSGVADVSLSGG
jgi:hypothetical protein